MIKKRKRLFEHTKKELKTITTNMIRNRKEKYYEKEVAKLSEEGAHAISYKALKNIPS